MQVSENLFPELSCYRILVFWIPAIHAGMAILFSSSE
jgi:hypothetical protein